MNRPSDVREHRGTARIADTPRTITVNSPAPPCKGWYRGLRLECLVGAAKNARAVVRAGTRVLARYEDVNEGLLPIASLAAIDANVFFTKTPAESVTVEVVTDDRDGATMRATLLLGGPTSTRR